MNPSALPKEITTRYPRGVVWHSVHDPSLNSCPKIYWRSSRDHRLLTIINRGYSALLRLRGR
uniref:Uncharacterized protein n=1 Tax=Anopheles quadriannulatus TaxID=34691 RepID=A0A182WXA0_ANOQN